LGLNYYQLFLKPTNQYNFEYATQYSDDKMELLVHYTYFNLTMLLGKVRLG